MLGVSQQKMAELIGVSLQQVHKYEMGTNRVSAGRLYQIAQALGTDVRYFFAGVGEEETFRPTKQQQRRLRELARNFMAIPVQSTNKDLSCWCAPSPSPPLSRLRLVPVHKRPFCQVVSVPGRTAGQCIWAAHGGRGGRGPGGRGGGQQGTTRAPKPPETASKNSGFAQLFQCLTLYGRALASR